MRRLGRSPEPVEPEPEPEPIYAGPRNPQIRPDDWPSGGLPHVEPANYDVSHSFAGMSDEAVARMIAHRESVRAALAEDPSPSVWEGLDAAEHAPDDYHSARAYKREFKRRMKALGKDERRRIKAEIEAKVKLKVIPETSAKPKKGGS